MACDHSSSHSGGSIVPDEPLCVSTDPHQHHHRTYLCYRWGSRVVNHFGASSATDSFLRSRVTGFTQGLENTEEPRRPLLGSSQNNCAATMRPGTAQVCGWMNTGFRE